VALQCNEARWGQCRTARSDWLDISQVIIAVVIEKRRLPPLPGAPVALSALVEQCTHPDPAVRPTFEHLITAIAQLIAAHSS
jgi:hypothetical protein